MTSPKRTGAHAALRWGAALALVALSLISTIGVFVLPVAIALVFVVARSSRVWPEILGGIGGPGVLLLVIATLHAGETPCPSGPEWRVQVMGPGEHWECSSFRAAPWYAVGSVLLLVGLAGYGLIRRRG